MKTPPETMFGGSNLFYDVPAKQHTASQNVSLLRQK